MTSGGGSQASPAVDQAGLNSLYNELLGRDTGAGAAGWLGKPEADVRAGILGSEEYLNKPAATTTSGGTGGFDIPTDAYPQSSQKINWDQNQLMSNILNELTGKVGTMGSDIDAAADKSNEYYSRLIKDALGPEGFRGTLNTLSDRNVLRSSEAGNALARTAGDLTRGLLQDSYGGSINALNRKTEIPERLGNLAQLGTETASSNKGQLYAMLADILMNQ